MTVTASASRTGSYTEPHRCTGCKKTFWANRAWNAITVKCPHCKRHN